MSRQKVRGGVLGRWPQRHLRLLWQMLSFVVASVVVFHVNPTHFGAVEAKVAAGVEPPTGTGQGGAVVIAVVVISEYRVNKVSSLERPSVFDNWRDRITVRSRNLPHRSLVEKRFPFNESRLSLGSVGGNVGAPSPLSPGRFCIHLVEASK